jgi:putative transposase
MQQTVDVKTAADLMGLSIDAVCKQVQRCGLPAQRVNDGGRGGMGGEKLTIPVEALPAEAQLRYFEIEGKKCGMSAMDADLVSYRDKNGEDALQELLKARRMVMIAKGIRETCISGVQKKLDALAKEHSTTIRTLYRLEKRFAELGLQGLMRKPRKDSRDPRTMCNEARRRMWEQYLQPPRRTQETVLRLTLDQAKAEGKKACANCLYREGSAMRSELCADDLMHFPACDKSGSGLIVPTNRSCVSRVISQLTDAEKTYLRKGRKRWEAEHMFKIKRAKPEKVNLCWFGDHHQLDLFVVNRQGKPIRPWLTGWYDIGSGRLVGRVLSECPNSQTIATAFTNAVQRTTNSDICGLPVYVYTDNGKDYRAERFEGGKFVEVSLGDMNESVRMSTMGGNGIGIESMYSLFDVQTVHAKEYHGWAKPIERWFWTLEHRFIKELPGYCGSNPGERAENFGKTLERLHERGELLNMDELYALLINEILPMYDATPHEGYGGRTPAELYRTLPKARDEVPGGAMLAIAKEEQAKRKVGVWGIRFNNVWYWDYAMTHYTGQWVQVLYDRDELSTLSIFTVPGNGKQAKFICVAEPKEELQMVGEDAEKLKRYVTIAKIQERELRRGLISKGVRLPGKRSSGNVYLEEIDIAYAKGNVTSLEYERVWAERNAARQRKADRDEAAAGHDEASAHFRRIGKELLELIK